MIAIIEDVRNEFKVKLTDNFEREVIPFFNKKILIIWKRPLPIYYFTNFLEILFWVH